MEWIINTRENVPKKNGLVLVNCRSVGSKSCTIDDQFIAYYKSGKGFEVWGSGRDPMNDFPVSHWMPLPDPPKP